MSYYDNLNEEVWTLGEVLMVVLGVSALAYIIIRTIFTFI